MSFIREAIRDKPVGLWFANSANPFNDISGYANNGSGTYNTALPLCANQSKSYVLDNSNVGKFPSPIFQKGKESQPFSMEAWVRPVQKTTGNQAQSYRENLILNPSFEVDLSSWSTTGTVARDSTMGAYGSASVKMTATALDNHSTFIYQQPAIPVSEGQTYTFSVWAKRITGTSNLRLILEKSLGVTFSGSDKTFTLTTSWARYSSTVTIPVGSGITSIIPFVSMDASTGAVGDVINADLVMLEQSSSLGAYLDGSMTGYEWEGIHHNSKSRTRLDVSLVSPVTNPSFEVDSNSDGLADNWTAYSLGTFGTRTYSLTSSGATTRGNAQRIQASGLAPGSGNRVGIVQGMQFSGVAGDTFTASADFTFSSIPAGAVVKFYVDFSAGSVWQESASYTLTAAGRRSFTYTLTKNITWASVYVWIEGDSLAATSAVDLTVDSIAVFRNSSRTAYLDGYSDGAIWTGTPESSMTLLLTSSSEQQILGNTGQYDGLVIDGTNISFVTKYLTTGEARATYDIQIASNVHLMGVHTSEKNSLYVNGELVSEVDISDVQAADSFLASDGFLYSGSTLSSRQIMTNGLGAYTYALSPDAIARHYAMGTDTVGDDTPVPYSGAVVRVSKNTNDILFDRYWQSDEDWKSADISGLTVDDAQLVPQQINGTSVSGTWIDTCDLYDGGVANTIHSVVVNWDGIGATVEASVDGTTWETCSRGVALTSIPAGFDPTNKELYMRVTFPGGIVDDASYLDNLNVTAFKTGSVTTSANRTVTYTAPAYIKREYDPAVLSDDWGVELAGGYVLLGPDTSDEPTGYQSLEVWFKFKDSSVDSRFIDTRDANNANNPLVAFQWTLGKIGGSGFYLYKNGISIPYGNGNLPEVGQWQVWHFVATAPVLTSTYINSIFNSSSYRGNVQVGRVVAYDDALTATQVANIVSSYTGHLVNNLTENEAVTVTEPTTSAQIYAHDWSIEASG